MLDHTFVILAYKESTFIRSCVESLLKQSAPSHIVISTSTPSPFLDSICHDYGLPLRVATVKHGIAADWTFAYEQASTKYVTLAHQDDIYERGYAERLVNCAEERESTLFAFSDYYELIGGERKDHTVNLAIKRLLRTLSYLGQRHISSKLRKRLLIAFGCPIPCPSVMFNKALIGDFSFSSEYSINMDWDAWYRLTEIPGSVACVPENLVGHRLHAESETTAGIGDRRRAQEDHRMFARIWPAPVARIIGSVYELGYKGNAGH